MNNLPNLNPRILYILILLSSLVFLGCREECETPNTVDRSSMRITYSAQGTGTCSGIADEDIEVNAFVSYDDEQVLSSSYWDPSTCELEIYFDHRFYWVINIASQGISDTLRVINSVFDEDFDERCAFSSYHLIGGTFTLNGQTFDTPDMQRDY